MSVGRMAVVAATCFLVGSLLSGPAAHAKFGSSPAQPPGTPPYGMNVQGDAGGTKLAGVFEINFSALHCTAPGSFTCTSGGPDLAMAKATLRLRKDNEIHTFYIDLGEVSFDDIPAIQALALEEFRAPILEAFFGVPQGTNSTLQVYLKEITQFSMGTIVNNGAQGSTYIVDPGDPVGNKIVEFSSIADLVVAVK